MLDIRSVDYKTCTGCAACMNICPKGAISMQENGEGFLYPVIDENKCIHCGLCYKKCPAMFPEYKNNETPDCYAVMADEALREVSSSGGMFSIIADYVLRRNGYVCGAAYGEDKITVKHELISAEEDLEKLRGSKYIQSKIGFTYTEIKEKLNSGAMVFFTGCPCQVAGLKSYLGKEYDNLITADLVCHGVPSHLVFEKFLKDLPENGPIESINFRQKKKYGWTHALQIVYKNGVEYYKPRWECDFYKVFLDSLAIRKSCGNCKFNKLPRQGDFTFGDFWGIGEQYPELDDKKGTGLVLINTNKADRIFKSIKHKIDKVKLVDIELARKSNARVFTTGKEHWERDRFMKIIQKYSFSSSYKRIKGRWFDVGIVGWWYGKNYGSALTYYALHEVVEGLGYDTLMLEWPWKKKPFPPISDNFVRRFAKKHYNMSAQYTFDEYPSLNNHINQFLVGSDQLWNYWDSKDMGNYYMLDFVREDRKKISYATSFGHPDYPAPKDVCEKQAEILKTFDAISVREDDGVRICREVFGVDATQVSDPVFLCPKEKYLQLISEAKINYDRPYLLSYILSPNKEKGEMLKSAADKLGLDLLIILDGQTDLEENKKRIGIDNVRQNVGIEDWLAYIYNASFVITDSFHGTCFSIIFKKQFICIINKARGISRFETLLNKLNLKSYSVSDISEVTEHITKYLKINYTDTATYMNAEVNRSYEWLKKALSMPHKMSIDTNFKKLQIDKAESNIPKKMNIMLILDENYMYYALPCIFSIIYNNKWANIHFHIITNNLSALCRQYIKDFLINTNAFVDFYDVDVSIFSGLKASKNYPSLLYSKLIPHIILPLQISKILYLDSDVIVTSSLQELYNTNLANNYIGACYDVGPFRKLMDNVTSSSKIELEYINSGMVLYNLDLMRKDKINLNTYTQWLKYNIQTLYEEQLLSNVLLGKIHHFMPYDYNFNIGERARYSKYCTALGIVEKKAIIHYMPFQNDSPIKKPWNAYQYFYYNKKNDIFSEELYDLYAIWWNYAKKMPIESIAIENNNLLSKWQIYANFFKLIITENRTIIKNIGSSLKKSMLLAGYKKIAIYGNTEITKVLLKILEETSIKIEYIVENVTVVGYKTIPRQTTKYSPVDIIIIADVANYDKIRDKLKNYINFPIKGALTFLKEIIQFYKNS